MKQETAPASKAESKSSGMSQSPTTTTTTPSRLRASAKSRDSPKPEAVLSPAMRGRAATTQDVMKSNLRSTRRSLVLTKPKSRDEVVGSQKGRELEEVRVVGRSGNRPVAVEQFARPRRLLRPMDYGSRRNEEDPDGKKKELVEKLELSETLIKNFQDEVLALKAELEKVQSLNVELQSQNKKLTENLSAAEAKIATLNSPQQKDSATGEYQRPNFKDIQKLIANKLENPKVKKETRITEVSIAKLPSPGPPPPPPLRLLKTVDIERKAPSQTSLQPPPPPPPPPRPPARAAAPRKAPSFEEFYQTLTKQEGKKVPAPLGPGNHNKPVTTNAHNSIVGEIQNRSAHLLAVKADIATKGEFINGLIQKVQSAAYANIEDVLKFVDWLDRELSSLADERAVLKHFKWPEKKADAMREAAIEYRDLKLLENEISSFQDDTNVPCGAALKRMASLLDKSERSIQRLIKLRNSVMRSYQECKIPTDWMLDSGIVSTIKKASMKLAKVYMKRVTMELESARNSDRESAQEALLLQGVHFAYRAHQFAGGLDSETMCAIEEIRRRVPGHLGGSQELLAAVPSS